jgi:S1-C subfamily serine protease
MKQLPRLGSLAVVLGCALAAPAWAAGGPLDFLHSLSQHFLLHSSQGYLGVDLKDVGSDADQLKLKDGHGVEVVAVDHDAPAAKAGLKIHDVILEMNGQRIGGCDQMRRMLRKQPPGRTVKFVISRDGTTMAVTLKLADRVLLAQQAWSQHFSVPKPDEPEEAAGGENFTSGSSGGSHFLGTLIPNSLYVGADVNPVRTQLADYFGVTSGTGLLVENVDSQSPAARAGLRAGDVILKVNNASMTSRGDWQKAIHSNRGKLVQVTIMRNKREQTLTMSAGQPKKRS